MKEGKQNRIEGKWMNKKYKINVLSFWFDIDL